MHFFRDDASRKSENGKISVLVIFYYFQQFSVGGLSFSQYLFDECSDSMQEAISGATAIIIYGLRIYIS